MVFAGNVEGSSVGRADDSTFTVQTPGLLLPNRNVDAGFTRLDLGFTYALLKHAVLFAQFTNLLNDQHIGPVGYPGVPFVVRVGLKLRIGGE